MLTHWLSRRRPRTAAFTARLPTELPGVSFTCKGQVWFWQDRATGSQLSVTYARSAVLAAVYDEASKTSKDFPPAGAFAVQQKIATAFADWQEAPGRPALTFKAKLAVDLLAEDAARAASFDETRRAARLDEAMATDHVKFLKHTALRDETTAGLWWLHRNIEGPDPDTSWNTFDHRVRPLIASTDANDDLTTRVTATTTALINRVRDNPEQLATLLNIASLILQSAGHPDLASELAPPLPRVSSTSEANGKR
jgi:hypothetical protein